jgi:hypothetical protein
MPRLILFAACQKAIWDAEEGAVSLIALVNGVTLRRSEVQQVLEAEKRGEDEVVMGRQRWSAVAVWRAEDGDVGKTFEQRIEIANPLGRVTGEAAGAFVFQNAAVVHTMRTHGDGLPINVPGQCVFRLSLREVVEGGAWTVKSEYPLDINYIDE